MRATAVAVVALGLVAGACTEHPPPEPAGRLDVGGETATAEGVSDSGWIVGSVHVPDSFGTNAYARNPAGATTVLGPPAFRQRARLVAVNDDGTAVGTQAQLVGTTEMGRALRWTPTAGPVTLDDWSYSAATDVDRAGRAVGILLDDAGPRAFVWEVDGTVRLLPTSAGATGSGVTALNDAGDVLGWETVEGRDTAVLWSRSGGAPTPLPLGGRLWSGDINSRGDVVGPVAGGGGDERAALLPAGAPRPVFLAGGTGRSWATAVNDAGAVVGWVTAADGQRHAAYWAAGTHAFTDLGVLDSVSSVAEDINEAGVVVGTVTDANGNTAAARFAAPAR